LASVSLSEGRELWAFAVEPDLEVVCAVDLEEEDWFWKVHVIRVE
jgi:hypothetical protein